VILIASLALNLVLSMECGLINEPKFLSGSVNESWRKTDTCIWFGTGYADGNDYYSNNGKDHIYHVDAEYGDSLDIYRITYEQDFSTFDDLEVYFVIEAEDGTQFATPVETSHTPTGDDEIAFQYSGSTIHIAEVWVRTVD